MNIGRSVKKLVIRDCANYDKVFNNIKDYCCQEWTKGYRCIFFIKENAKCDYFDRAVLPNNPQIEALYRAEQQAKIEGCELSDQSKKQILEEKSLVAGKIKIHCKKCGKTFMANNLRQQYCDYCKKSIRREKRYLKIKNTP
ncbi:hypothetical protein ES695_20545 [Candidatus Atribacteria bacterium 1244-E10-H5-B2]|nr:MAG: hypothetical protein ES695_20545 [Candidatus Atribacteria bacterium 1244-E10-H5-B2]